MGYSKKAKRHARGSYSEGLAVLWTGLGHSREESQLGPLAPSERRGEGCRGEGPISRETHGVTPHPAPLSPLRGARGPNAIIVICAEAP